MSQSYTLFGAEFSLYSGKLRSYLRKKGIAYQEINASAGVYKKFIVPRTGVRFIPVLQTPEDQVLQDTSVIIDWMEQRHPAPAAYPNTPRQKLAALILELFGDEWLLLPAMHYRWHYAENHAFIYGEFGGMLFPFLPRFAQRFVGKRIGGRFKAIVPRLGITDRTRPALESWYEALLADLEAHFAVCPFLLGERPTLADYGFIGPFYAHLYRDPWPGRLMRKLAPGVAAWVERMINSECYQGDLPEQDEIPATLMPILQRFADEQLPVLLDTAKCLQEWQQEHADEELPRTLDERPFKLNGVEDTRVVIPYSHWMFQRPLDYYQGLQGAEREAADSLLEQLGIRSAFEQSPPVRLKRVENKLWFEAEKD